MIPKNLNENLIIGITQACKLLGWSSGKFGGYFYKKNVPDYQIVGNKPCWDKKILLEWNPEKKPKGRKKKSFK